MAENTLYYGDNLDILPQHIKDESVDLIYLDPPFNSKATYNMLFKEEDGTRAAAQIKAFTDTWRWDKGSFAAYQKVVEAGGKVSEVMQAFHQFLGGNNMMAYLSMMAPRLKELHRVLKSTGSIYLHCDPTASHYLKLLMDAVFGVGNFRNEIVWQRTGAHSDANRWGRVSDTLLFYTKSDEYTWHTQYVPYDEEYVEERYHYKDDKTGRLFWPNTMTAAGPGPAREFRGKSMPPPAGTHWRFSQKNIDQMEAEDRIYYSTNGIPYVKSFLDEQKGKPIQNIWVDIRMTKSGSERLHYPTQKPLELLKRVVAASSNPGDVILDPFCGCGTTIDATERINYENSDKPPRQWIGIDITHIAINLIKYRLYNAFGDACKYVVVGEPTTLPDAQQLAREKPDQFQLWALGLVAARTAEGIKKGADKGIDGKLYFHDDVEGEKTKLVILSVKAGENVTVAHVRDLRGVVERERAAIGVLISMHGTTGPMRAEAAEAGIYDSPWGTKHPRLQLLTVEDLLAGKKIDMPPTRDERTFKKAEKFKAVKRSEGSLPFDTKATP